MKRTAAKTCRKIPKIEVIDLFCGIGGLSFGMKRIMDACVYGQI